MNQKNETKERNEYLSESSQDEDESEKVFNEKEKQ